MRTKEIILYDSYYSIEKDQDIREYLFDSYADEKGWKTKEDIPDSRVIEEWENQDGILWNELKDNLESYFDNSYYLLTGYFGSWHGKLDGGNFIRSFKDFLTVIQHLDDIRMIDRNGHFIIEGSHHDGSDRYEIKRLTRKGYELAGSYHFAKDRKLHYTLMHNNFYTALPHFAQQIYGGK